MRNNFDKTGKTKNRQKEKKEKMKDGDRYFLEVFPQYISQVVYHSLVDKVTGTNDHKCTIFNRQVWTVIKNALTKNFLYKT